MPEVTNILLVVGEPDKGKSHSLMHFRNPKEVGIINCDKKVLPFNKKKANFLANVVLEDPEDLLDYIDIFEDKEELKIGVIDTTTDLMKEFRIQNVDDAADSRAGWGAYLKFYCKFMNKLKHSSKTWVLLAHVDHTFDEKREEDVSSMVIQGGAGKAPISDFSVVVEADCRVITKKIKNIKNDFFTISPKEAQLGIVYHFITTRTKDHPGTLARSPSDMWDFSEVYIDNNIQNVLDVMEEYYSDQD